MNVLYSPDGRKVPAGTPTEATRLRARGYTDQPPFVPGDHPVPEVVEHVEAHPEEANAVLAAERRGKDRKTITGS